MSVSPDSSSLATPRAVAPIGGAAAVAEADVLAAPAEEEEEEEVIEETDPRADPTAAPPLCTICYERPGGAGAALSSCLAHSGAFCTPCLVQHAVFSVDNNRMPVRCPMAPECDAVFDGRTVHAVLCACTLPLPENYNAACEARWNENGDPADAPSLQTPRAPPSTLMCSHPLFVKYLMRRDLKANPLLHACPKCDALCAPLSTSDMTEISCHVCAYTFCSVHGDAHPGKSCSEHEALRPIEAKEADALSAKAIADTSKPCPHCQTPIFHAGGCNHVVCQHCDKDFCFGCGSAAHLEGRMFRTCKKCNSQFFDHRYECEMRAKICLCLPCWLPLFLAWMAIFVAVFVGTLACCCLCCGHMVKEWVRDDRGMEARVRPFDVARCILQPCCGPLINILLFFGRCGHCLVRPLLTENQLNQMGLGPMVDDDLSQDQDDDGIDLEVGVVLF